MNSNTQSKRTSSLEALRRNVESAWKLAKEVQSQTVMSDRDLEKTNTRIQVRSSYSDIASTLLGGILRGGRKASVVRCTHYRKGRAITPGHPPYTAVAIHDGELLVIARAE